MHIIHKLFTKRKNSWKIINYYVLCYKCEHFTLHTYVLLKVLGTPLIEYNFTFVIVIFKL